MSKRRQMDESNIFASVDNRRTARAKYAGPERLCDCTGAAMQVAHRILNENSVPFDVLLLVSQRLKPHWKEIRKCSQCCYDENRFAPLVKLLSRLLGFYQAAFCAYSIPGARKDGQVIHPTTSGLPTAASFLSPSSYPSRSIMCLTASITVGTFTLDSSESRLIALKLLAESLADLHASLDDLEHETRGRAANSNLDPVIDALAQLNGRIQREFRNPQRFR